MVSCNQAFSDLIGYSRDEIATLSWKTDLTPPEYRKLTEDAHELLHKTRQPVKLEKEYVRKDGSRVYINLKINLLSDDEGRPSYYYFFVDDMSGYKQSEKILLEHEAAFKKVQYMAHVGYWYLDMSANKMYWSDELYRILGFNPAEQEPSLEMYLKAIRPEDRDLIGKIIAEVADLGTVVNMDYSITGADGAVRHMHAEIQAIMNSRGNPQKIFGTVQDVTSAKRAEAMIRESKKQAELYVDLLSHDINNINQVAIGNAELALQAMENGQRDLQLLDKTIDMLNNSSRLIRNVRMIRRIKSGEVRPELIDLGSMIQDVISQYSSVRGREILINHHVEGSCKVIASELMREVFSNLIGNSIKHSSGPISIDIDVAKIRENNMEYYKVAVNDNGPGIPDEKKKVLFTRYMQGTTSEAGTGLGLYLVKSLVETFEGRVWAEDRVAGDHTRGSRFIILLPSADNNPVFSRSEFN